LVPGRVGQFRRLDSGAGMRLLAAESLGTFPFLVTDLAAFLEDLLHEVISGKDSARAAPILGTSCPGAIGK
jgi:hypothetical protein